MCFTCTGFAISSISPFTATNKRPFRIGTHGVYATFICFRTCTFVNIWPKKVAMCFSSFPMTMKITNTNTFYLCSLYHLQRIPVCSDRHMLLPCWYTRRQSYSYSLQGLHTHQYLQNQNSYCGWWLLIPALDWIQSS